MDFIRQKQHVNAATYDAGLREYMLKIYNYMTVGLGITGIVAWLSAVSGVTQAIFSTPILGLVVAFAPVIMVFALVPMIQRMSFASAQLAFFAFAAVMGISLSSIFLAYTGMSIAKVFFITSATFGAMSIYGYTTKKDLSSMGSLLFMGAIGILIASIVNMFLGSPALQFAISIFGVLIGIGFTAYDTQKIKQIYYQIGGTGEAAGKAAIFGALNLYMDFIYLMIHLLQLLGDRR